MTTNRALQPTPVICLLHHYLVLPISIFNIKPHLDAFEAGLWFLWLESIAIMHQARWRTHPFRWRSH
ncbi:hypothetical protein [Nostoc sp.]|uniref:hypothetical protein n=1 Tax=Nostoc sp. TaxID=1180 RepID=UPI002FF6C400